MSVTIALTPEQVRQVLDWASGSDLRSSVLPQIQGHHDYRQLARGNPRLSGSLLTGLEILGRLADGEPKSLAEIAGESRIGRSTAHRYLATLLAAGLLHQDPRTRRYRVPQVAV